jgi:hypothetical protein
MAANSFSVCGWLTISSADVVFDGNAAVAVFMSRIAALTAAISSENSTGVGLLV